jgi:hypothetical protein
MVDAQLIGGISPMKGQAISMRQLASTVDFCHGTVLILSKCCIHRFRQQNLQW